MAVGRCSGCKVTGPRKKIENHVLSCPQYLELFRADPARALDPVTEARRYAQEDTCAARAARRDVRLRERFAEMDAHASAQADRWRVPHDILEDMGD